MKAHSTVQQMPYDRQNGKWPRTISHTNSHGKNLFAVWHTRVKTRAGVTYVTTGAGDGDQPEQSFDSIDRTALMSVVQYSHSHIPP
jgi:hypothetical protein